MNNKPSRQAPFQSLVTFKNSQGDTARGTLLTIERGTVVFEVYHPYSIVQLSEVLKDLTIRRAENAVYQGRRWSATWSTRGSSSSYPPT